MTQSQVVEINIVSKLSMRTIKTQPAKFATAQGAPIATIFGMAQGIKEVVDKVRGDVYHALTGQFEAQNLETGEVYRSGQLYLPTGIHEMIEGAVKKLEADTDFVRFALQISAVTASNPAGYSYIAKSLIKAETVDPLDTLRLSLTSGSDHELSAAPAKKKK